MKVPTRKAENQYACVACDASDSNMCLSIVIDQYNTIQYNTTLLSLSREICFLARHLHKNIQYS